MRTRSTIAGMASASLQPEWRTGFKLFIVHIIESMVTMRSIDVRYPATLGSKISGKSSKTEWTELSYWPRWRPAERRSIAGAISDFQPIRRSCEAAKEGRRSVFRWWKLGAEMIERE